MDKIISNIKDPLITFKSQVEVWQTNLPVDKIVHTDLVYWWVVGTVLLLYFYCTFTVRYVHSKMLTIVYSGGGGSGWRVWKSQRTVINVVDKGFVPPMFFSNHCTTMYMAVLRLSQAFCNLKLFCRILWHYLYDDSQVMSQVVQMGGNCPRLGCGKQFYRILD